MSNLSDHIVGHWKSVEDGMPDDGISCLVWSSYRGEASIAYHDSEVREARTRRGKSVISGWVTCRGRVIPDVSHYCADIHDPCTSEYHFPGGEKMASKAKGAE